MKITDFENIIATDRLTLVDFFQPWCGPCRAIDPALERLALTMSHICTIIKLNTIEREHRELIRRYNIVAIPSLLLFTRSELINRITGIISYDRLMALIREAQVVLEY
ncbi:MAG: thioredoxin family protein [Rikenellaceae bacterium]|nr:thioredoxin family protein [Rikenellaceae bacterium]